MIMYSYCIHEILALKFQTCIFSDFLSTSAISLQKKQLNLSTTLPEGYFIQRQLGYSNRKNREGAI